MSHSTPDAGEVLLTKADIVRRHQVSLRTVNRWIHDGKLRAYRVGNGVRIRPADLAEFITPIGGDS
ncbi:helix-turn-helix domain-containing protein [Rhodococcus sp. 114MFTsu3.1]|uniref:helix-turn-helix domain-containing protein n=1 Tax=Rhodococcus sp. 114MFTsu3.1 TaxID=1172184 RepID=UPI00036847F3|nr:helix-turn-helix domain-containing protein [Rhodococcus sp. 114MFTsu3.1]